MSEEQWDEGDLETLVTDCERCGNHRPCQLVSDPFAVEGISDDDPNEREWWCRPCWDQRAGDV